MDEIWGEIHNSAVATYGHIAVMLYVGWLIARAANITRLSIIARVPIWFLLTLLMLLAACMSYGAIAITMFRPKAWVEVMPDDFIAFIEYTLNVGVELGALMVVGILAWTIHAAFRAFRGARLSE